jgi:hypothetical protein
MTTDDKLEVRLRHELTANETNLPPSPDLAQRTSTLGRRAIRRTRIAMAATSIAVAGVAVGGVVTAGHWLPTVDQTGPTGTPHTPTSSPIESPDRWPMSLPLGAPPEIPYLIHDTLYLPGKDVDLGGDGAGIVGHSVAGTVVLVDTDAANGAPFSSRYVLVSDDGQVADLPISTRTPAQEALISPDGQFLAAHRSVYSLPDLTVTTPLPADAEMLVSWTPAGIVYGTHSHGYYLWDPADQGPSLKLDGYPGFYSNGSDYGLRNEQGCSAMVQISPQATVTTRYKTCQGDRLITVSPTGEWAVTNHLRLINTHTGANRPLSHTAVAPRLVGSESRWIGDDEVLLTFHPEATVGFAPTKELVLRCRPADATCERATKTLHSPPTGGIDLA